MSHAYVRLVADRTDPFRPIPQQKTDPTRQEIHRESITGPARTKTPKTRREDYFEEVRLPSDNRKERKQETKRETKSSRKLQRQKSLEAVYSQNEQEKQEEYEDYASYMQEKQEIYEQQQKEIIVTLISKHR